MKCLKCKKELTGKQRKYCSIKCRREYYFREYYNKNKKVILAKNKKWGEDNPERVKEIQRKTLKKKRLIMLAEKIKNPKYCQECKKLISPETLRVRFCSSDCAISWHNREDYYIRRDKINKNPFLKWLIKRKRRQYYRENKERFLEANKRWAEKHPEQYRELMKNQMRKRYEKLKDKKWFKEYNNKKAKEYYRKRKLDKNNN